jgi:glycosyltransferase involved in cell wall biosynthesis
MKIATVVNNLERGGTQRCAQNYAEIYQELGHDSRVFGVYGGGIRKLQLEERGIPAYAGTTDNAFSSFIEFKPDVLHVHRSSFYDDTFVEYLKAARAAGSIVVQTNVFAKPDYTKNRSLVDVDLEMSAWGLHKWLARMKGVDHAPQSIVMPYFVKTEAFKRASVAVRVSYRESCGIPRDAFVFGRIGQPIEAKWSTDIIQAFNQTAFHHPNAYLLLIGAPPNVVKMATNSTYRDRIKLVDPIDGDAQLSIVYSSFDVFLHSATIGESFGMVLVEASLCDVLIITRARLLRDNAQAEIVPGMHGGHVVWDSSALARAMNLAATKNAGESNARQYADANFGFAAGRTQLGRMLTIITNYPKAEWSLRFAEIGVISQKNIPTLDELISVSRPSLNFVERCEFNMVHQRLPYLFIKKIKDLLKL